MDYEILTGAEFLTNVMFPFFEVMKDRMNKADTKEEKQAIAKFALATYRYVADKGYLSRRTHEQLEEYDIPYFEMYASGCTVYDAQ